ncbi:MAG: HD-GYP domain-containing protein [Spirochaetaceae bacterium]|jgi:HD-GYP domain-containing protein (c-di-GMP phosphodiesterase class II)|nr:HD-GYP domain-containing protein [Spirochaetaceae bacterium]
MDTLADSGAESNMKNYGVKNIPPGAYFSKPAYLDDGFILAAPETPFTEAIIKILLDWDFRKVLSEGECLTEYHAEDSGFAADEETPDAGAVSDREKIKRAAAFYNNFTGYVETLFTDVVIKDELIVIDVVQKIKQVCDFVKKDHRFLLRVQRMNRPKPEQNYLTSHAVKSTIISLVIGYYLKLPYHRLIELGVAALLHEIGMIQLPPQIYSNKRGLSPQERKVIFTHPILGYNLLKSFGFPLAVSVAALEHHERENGGGYPQKLTGDKISLYAKIIAVACSYEALTANRPHRAAKDPYTGMLDLLKNEGKQYDETIIRALVYSLSIYPIGLYVLLSNGKKAQVVDVNPEKPQFPVVLFPGELTVEGKNKTLETSPEGVHILRPLTREELQSHE